MESPDLPSDISAELKKSLYDLSVAPQWRLVKVLIAFVFIAAIMISSIGLLIVREIGKLSSIRESGLQEIREEFQELKNIRAKEAIERTAWRSEIERQLRELKETKPKDH